MQLLGEMYVTWPHGNESDEEMLQRPFRFFVFLSSKSSCFSQKKGLFVFVGDQHQGWGLEDGVNFGVGMFWGAHGCCQDELISRVIEEGSLT